MSSKRRIIGIIVDEPRYQQLEETNEIYFNFQVEDKDKKIINIAITSLVTNDYALYKLGQKVDVEVKEVMKGLYQATKITFIPTTKYNKDFDLEFEKAKKRFNDIAIATGREHLVLDNEIAISNGARTSEPEAYPENWTLADLVAESDYQAQERKEMLQEYNSEEKSWIRNEFNRWNNFKNHYLPLVKEMNIPLFCNHCSSLDVKKEDTLFYKEKNEEIEEDNEI